MSAFHKNTSSPAGNEVEATSSISCKDVFARRWFARHLVCKTLCRWATLWKAGPAPQQGENRVDQIVIQVSISRGAGGVTGRSACRFARMAHLSASSDKQGRLMPAELGWASPTDAICSPPAPLVRAASSLQNKHTKRSWNCQVGIRSVFMLRVGRRRKHQSQKGFQDLDVWLYHSVGSNITCQLPSGKTRGRIAQPLKVSAAVARKLTENMGGKNSSLNP